MYVTKKRNKRETIKYLFFNATFIMIKRKSSFYHCEGNERKSCRFGFRIFVVKGFSRKTFRRTHSCVRREIILVGLYWEQNSTALKRR